MKAFGLVVLIVSLAGCSGDAKTSADSVAATAPEATVASEPASESGPVTLTAADLDGFEKGIVRETHLVREGQVRAGKAVTPVERGNAIQSTFEENTITGAIQASGLSLERYRLVRQTLSRLLTTLDFQGKIDGPMQIDLSRVDEATKARIARDPFTDLSPESAAALRAAMDRLVPIWIEYVKMTAVAG